MEPIINPLWIYLAELCGNLRLGIGLCGVVSVIIVVIWSCLYYIEEAEHKCPRCFIVLSILMVLCNFLPSQKTVLTMMAVSQITPNNIEIVGDTGKDLVDYVMEKVDEIINADEDNG